MTYLEQLKRIRRFLRDPDSNIWEDDYLKTTFNDVQRDLNHETSVLEDVDILRSPPRYQMSYMFDFEYQPGRTKYYRAKILHHSGMCVDHEWEIQSLLGLNGIGDDSGSRVFHPWEAWISPPNDVIPLQLPDDLNNIKFLAYDNEPLGYIDKKAITCRDSTYKTREGEPAGYYREDELENDFIPYPRPSSVVWNDIEDIISPDFIYVFDFESALLSGVGDQWMSEGTYHYLFTWEETLDLREDGMRGMYSFERDFTLGGQVVYLSSDTGEPYGVITDRPGSFFSQEEGVTIDIIPTDDNFLIVFDCDPREIDSLQDESPFPDYLQKYIEYGVLERAYMSNTDGRIKTLANYWGLRYELGKQSIKKFKGLKKQDRDYRLMTSQRQPLRKYRHPRLPDAYPSI